MKSITCVFSTRDNKTTDKTGQKSGLGRTVNRSEFKNGCNLDSDNNISFFPNGDSNDYTFMNNDFKCNTYGKVASIRHQVNDTETNDGVASTMKASGNSSNYQTLPSEYHVPLVGPQGTVYSGFRANTTGEANSTSPAETRKQGVYPTLSSYYDSLHHSNVPNTKVYRVEFTNWCFYSQTKDGFDHIVFIHNVKDNQRWGFYYLINYLLDMSVFVYNRLSILAGELKIVNFMAMLLNIEAFDSVEYPKLLTKSQ